MGMAAKPNHRKSKPIRNRRRANVKFEDLPDEVLCTILSKLPTKEAAKTSVLSSKWRSMWMIFPKLRFNGVAMLGHNRYQGEECTWKFIDNVNTALQKLRGNVVEELDVKFELNSMLVDHLNNWVSFAVSSKTKKLAFDLVPDKLWERDDRYRFPFELLDSESISRLQHIQLSFVSLKPPSQFRGFPNLTKLDLHYLDVSTNDLQGLLSNCCNLEWLSIARCHLHDELRVDRPLSRLLHLQVLHCRLDKIELHAIKLASFVYKGNCLHIDLRHSSELESAYICFLEAIFQRAVCALLNGLRNVKNLTLHLCPQRLETTWLLDNPYKFSQLRYLQLFLLIEKQDVDKILSVVSVLGAAPFLEKFEVHFSGYALRPECNMPRILTRLPQCRYNHLKDVHVTGYKGGKAQLEFLVHTVENAPALEVLTINTAHAPWKDTFADKAGRKLMNAIRRVASDYFGAVLSPKVKLSVL